MTISFIIMFIFMLTSGLLTDAQLMMILNSLPAAM
jgi:hypothetical protein